MTNSYWDLYVAYVNKCAQSNWANDIDPHHYEMEWNHFLPKCVFGDWPIGHYLSIKQHAIASALQTLAFGKNCICRWHIKFLPAELWELCKPFYSAASRKNGSVGGSSHANPSGAYSTMINGKGLFDPANGERVRDNQKVQGSYVRDNKLGIHDPSNHEKCKQGNKKGGQVSTSQVWVSTIDGYTSNAACVARHNQKMGQDPDARVRIR